MKESIFTVDGSSLRPDLERVINLASSKFWRRAKSRRYSYDDLLQLGRLTALERRDELELRDSNGACAYLYVAVHNRLIGDVARLANGKICAPTLARVGEKAFRFIQEDSSCNIPARLSREFMRDFIDRELERKTCGRPNLKTKLIVPMVFDGVSYAQIDKKLELSRNGARTVVKSFCERARKQALKTGIITERDIK